MVLGGDMSCKGCLLCGCDEYLQGLTRRTNLFLHVLRTDVALSADKDAK